MQLRSYPVFDQPFLGKTDRIEVVSDARGRFRASLIPGRRYLAWGIGGKGKNGLRTASLLDMVFARGHLQLKEGDWEARSYQFQLGGRERWKGDLLVLGNLQGQDSLARILTPDERGVYETPLWPGKVLVRVFTKAGLKVGQWSFPLDEREKGSASKGTAPTGLVRNVQVLKIIQRAKALKKGKGNEPKPKEPEKPKKTSKKSSKKQDQNKGAAKKQDSKKNASTGSSPRNFPAEAPVRAVQKHPAPKDLTPKSPALKSPVPKSPVPKEGRLKPEGGGKKPGKESEENGEEKAEAAPPVPGIPVLELYWHALIKLKVRKREDGKQSYSAAPKVRLRVLPPDKTLGLFDWIHVPPLTVTDEEGMGLLDMAVPPGKNGQVSQSWRMIAESEGYCWVFPSLYRKLEYPKDSKDKTIKDKSPPLTMNLFSRKSFSLKGRLLGREGKPIAHRPLLLYTSRPSSANGWSHGRDPLFVGTTGANGSFELNNLDPRSTQVVTVLLSEEERASLGGGSPWMDARAVIFFRQDGRKKVDEVDLEDFSLKDLHRLELKVAFLDNSPAPFSRVLIAETQMHPNGLIGIYYPLQGFTDRRGRFAMLLPDCEATIGVIGQMRRMASQRLVLKGKKGGKRELLFTLGQGKLLRGVVVDSDGKPFSGASIYVNLYNTGRNQSGWIFSTFRQNNSTKADEKGRFQVRAPVGSRIYLSARYKVGPRWFYSRGVQIQVEEDIDPDPLELQIPTEAPKPPKKPKSPKKKEKPAPSREKGR
ncbi:MAG TPA: hypothetical protein ENK02_04930 [Planctomycetes bacterium]|nr:hypothetical protein [Planctomycetota bacterium]